MATPTLTMVTPVFIHKKTGNLYKVMGRTMCANNANNGVPMVRYLRMDGSDPAEYCRDETEFNEKFVHWGDLSSGNIFVDLGFSENEAAKLLEKAQELIK